MISRIGTNNVSGCQQKTKAALPASIHQLEIKFRHIRIFLLIRYRGRTPQEGTRSNRNSDKSFPNSKYSEQKMQ